MILYNVGGDIYIMVRKNYSDKVNFWEQIRRHGGEKYLFIISDDAIGPIPAWTIRWWNVTGHRNINSYHEFSEANDKGQFKDGWGHWIDRLYEFETDGNVYPTLDTAQKQLRMIWAEIKADIDHRK